MSDGEEVEAVLVQVSNQRRAEQMEVLTRYLGAQDDGAALSWERIEADTHVEMSPRGRQMVTRACGRIGRVYEAKRGVGIAMSSAESAAPIAVGACQKVRTQAENAVRVAKRLLERHEEQLSGDDKKRILATQSLNGQIAAVLDKGPRILMVSSSAR